MKICGCDVSINSPGLVKFELDENLEIISTDFLGFTGVKKNLKLTDKVEFFSGKMFDNYLKKNWHVVDRMIDFISDCDYVAMEDYALQASGKVFHIAEMNGLFKHQIRKTYSDVKLRLIEPTTLKMFATDNGTADKYSMWESFVDHDHSFDISMLPPVEKRGGAAITSDIVDGFWLAEMLLTELKLRKGLILLKDLTEKQIGAFQRTSKANPENLLVRDYL